MPKAPIDDYVLPRPVEPLPEYAQARARQNLADKIVETFMLSPESATAIANAVVDPSKVRKSIGEPTDPEVEKIPVPGGTLWGIRTTVWARRIMPDPRNPRTLPSRKHPFAIEPGSGAEDSLFRPVPEPRALDDAHSQKAELVVDIENRDHLIWAAQQASSYVLADNDWRVSIASQGVMEAVWLVATTYQHADGSTPATTLTTAEGSSRTTAVHDLLKVVSADVPYDTNEAKFRQHIRKQNEAFELEPKNDVLVTLRCERMPALILVGFKPNKGGTTGFPTAVKSMVALRHVDPPKPWGEGPENESLADEVLDELHRRGLISAAKRNYFAGSCTRAEAAAAHLQTDPVLRATHIVDLFTGKDESIDEAIRVAVTSQSTRKRITPKLMNELATALILRAIADDPAKTDQIRRYLRHAFGKAVHRAGWKSTNRPTEVLVKEALAEVQEWIASPGEEEPGPASLELAVRGAYPLVVSGRLNADRGSAHNDQPDRRNPGEVLDAMRRSPQGIHQLAQALRDYAADTHIRAVDEDGNIKRSLDNEVEYVNDIFLRTEFPPPGKAQATRSGTTPTDRYRNALSCLGVALQTLDGAFTELTKVVGDDGRSLVDTLGVEPRLTDPWRNQLRGIDEELVVWARAFRKKNGMKIPAPAVHDDEDQDEEADPYDQGGRDADNTWAEDDVTLARDAAE